MLSVTLALGGAYCAAAHAEEAPAEAAVSHNLDVADQLELIKASGCRNSHVDLAVLSPVAPSALRASNSFQIEIADTPEERARGLMYRKHMPADHGMLFIYERPGPADFWMKNTLIPLDIIFADKRGRVGHVHHNAQPLDLTPIHGGKDVLYVLEINAGLARELGIDVGAVLRHPRFGGDAIWACP